MVSPAKHPYNLCVDKPEESPAAKIPRKSPLSLSPQVEIFKVVLGRMFAISPAQKRIPDSDSNTLNKTIDLCSSTNSEGSDDSVAIIDSHNDILNPSTTSIKTTISKVETNIYEKALEDENKHLKILLNEVVPLSDDPKDDVIALYKSRNAVLLIALKEAESKAAERLEIQEKNEKMYKERIARLEDQIMGLHQGHEIEMQQVLIESQQLIDEIINSQLKEIETWKREFYQDCTASGKGKWASGSDSDALLRDYEVIALPLCGSDSIPLQLLQKFRELSPTSQGVMAVGIGIVVLVVGYNSWSFISWDPTVTLAWRRVENCSECPIRVPLQFSTGLHANVTVGSEICEICNAVGTPLLILVFITITAAWPRLDSFATRFEVVSISAWIYTFIQSTAFRDFVKAWEEGRPFTPLLIKNFGPDVVRNLTKLAPKLLRASLTSTTTKT